MPNARVGGIGLTAGFASGIAGAGWGPMGMKHADPVAHRSQAGHRLVAVSRASSWPLSAVVGYVIAATAFQDVVPDWWVVVPLFVASIATMIPGAMLVSRLGRERATIADHAPVESARDADADLGPLARRPTPSLLRGRRQRCAMRRNKPISRLRRIAATATHRPTASHSIADVERALCARRVDHDRQADRRERCEHRRADQLQVVAHDERQPVDGGREQRHGAPRIGHCGHQQRQRYQSEVHLALSRAVRP